MNQLPRQKRSISGKIYAKSMIRKYPFVASLHRTRFGHICGGSIISESHVITAADCVKNFYNLTENDYYYVNVGSYSSTWGGSIRKVVNCTIHPGNDSTRHSFAILKLEKPIDFNNIEKKPADMFEAHEEIKNGSSAVSVGWGCSLTGLAPSTLKLRELNMEVIDKKECKKLHEKSENAFFDVHDDLQEGETCAEDVSTCSEDRTLTICDQDDGGALVVNGKLAAIALRVMKYDDNRWFTVFLEIAPYRKLIDEQLAL